MTKILLISGESDYAVCVFEQECTLTKEQAYQKCVENGGHYSTTDEECDSDVIEFKSFVFPDVPVEFMKFIKGEQDYDDSKHRDWVVID